MRGKGFGELAERIVDRRAAVGGRERHVDGIERVEPQDVFCVDRVGIAQPVLDRGDRHFQRPRRARRPRLGLLDRRDLGGLVQRVCELHVFLAGANGRLPELVARDRLQPVQEARGHRRCAAGLGGMGEDHLVAAEQLREVMRGEADTALRQIETKLVPHRPAEPGIDPRRRRPDALDQPADDDAVGLHQARFQRAVDLQARARLVPPPHRAVAECGLEHVGIVGQRHHQSAGRAAAQEIVEGAGEREAFALLEGERNALLVARQLDHDLAMAMRELGEVKRL